MVIEIGMASKHFKNSFREQPEDNYYMMLAIAEAKKGLYTTRPNPAVGCVIVQHNQIIGTGFHPKAGMPHAEVFALRAAINQGATQVQDATAYVTLEPCSHTGRTPPCAVALIKAGIQRVVIAGLDPNPKVAGRGVALLQEAGIQVTIGVGQQQAQQLNLGFLKAMQTGMPYVRLKIAASLDGRTAMASGESKWITGVAARQDVQRLRAVSGAIITGSQTIIDDNPSLNVRSPQLGVEIEKVIQPQVVVLDRRQRLTKPPLQGFSSHHYSVLTNPSTLIWTNSNLKSLLSHLVQEHQVYDVLVESGAKVAASFIEAGLVDELIVYQAPCLLGSRGKPMVDINIDHLASQYRFQLQHTHQLDQDIKLTFTPY